MYHLDFPFDGIYEWYKKHGRHSLPWRDYQKESQELCYHVWLAEILLQQTQAQRVSEYFLRIIEDFPDIEKLANSNYDGFFPYYQGLGYYSRARNILRCAQVVHHQFAGCFPQDTKQLVALPGVGPYTAEAIRAFGHNIPTLCFDTNLEKVFSRYFFGTRHRKLTQKEKGLIVEQYQKTSLSPRDINNALMDYAACISLNNKEKIVWEDDPLTCGVFYETRGEKELNVVKKTSSFPSQNAYIFCILHEDHRVYFSQTSDFSAFFIGKNIGNPRKIIKEYFLKNYKLHVSVRPPEVQSYLPNEQAYIVCYAQIQTGNAQLYDCKNLQVRGFEESIIEAQEKK